MLCPASAVSTQRRAQHADVDHVAVDYRPSRCGRPAEGAAKIDSQPDAADDLLQGKGQPGGQQTPPTVRSVVRCTYRPNSTINPVVIAATMIFRSV